MIENPIFSVAKSSGRGAVAVLLLLAGRAAADSYTPTANGTLEERSREAFAAIKAHNMAALAALVHPSKGVRFSPHGKPDLEHDQWIPGRHLAFYWEDPRPRVWGQDPRLVACSGEPIHLTLPAYFDEFVYDGRETSHMHPANSQVPGDSMKAALYSELIAHAYPEGRTVHYVSDAMHWKRLSFVFEPVGGTWFLVGIVQFASVTDFVPGPIDSIIWTSTCSGSPLMRSIPR